MQVRPETCRSIELCGESCRHESRRPQIDSCDARVEPDGDGHDRPGAGQCAWQFFPACRIAARPTAACRRSGAGRCGILAASPRRSTSRARAAPAGADNCPHTRSASADPASAGKPAPPQHPTAACSRAAPGPGAPAAAPAGSSSNACTGACTRYARQLGRSGWLGSSRSAATRRRSAAASRIAGNGRVRSRHGARDRSGGCGGRRFDLVVGRCRRACAGQPDFHGSAPTQARPGRRCRIACAPATGSDCPDPTPAQSAASGRASTSATAAAAGRVGHAAKVQSGRDGRQLASRYGCSACVSAAAIAPISAAAAAFACACPRHAAA
ncbi:hypothetical protein C7451_1164 [Blastomonas natatoria]|uniref:Uncharacterized protein n=1 Tax=Blastomonas natatoria TaxID=34015 RepID=A0A2V3UQR6_9SPHN|nr:hypothetical protein C7451_1164 [Blastomonas natatoria]